MEKDFMVKNHEFPLFFYMKIISEVKFDCFFTMRYLGTRALMVRIVKKKKIVP